MPDNVSRESAGQTDSASEQARLDAWHRRTQAATSALVFFQLIAIMFGCGFLFMYFIRHGFYPGALSISDTFALLFLVFGFAAVWVVSIAYATLAGFPIARTLQYAYSKVVPPTRFVWRDGYGWMCGGGALCLVSFGLAAATSRSSDLQVMLLSLLGYGVFASFLAFGRFTPPPPGSASLNRPLSALDRWFARRSDTVRGYVVIVFTATGLLGILFPTFQDMAMVASGFRKQNVSVQLDKADFSRIVERASLLGIAINPCAAIEADSYVLEHVDILWYQAGARSLLRFPSVPMGMTTPAGNAAFLYESSKPVGNLMPAARMRLRCEEIPADLLFAPGTAVMGKRAGDVLATRLAWLEQLEPGRRLRVSAHGAASAVGYKKPDVTVEQATLVAQWLAHNAALRTKAIEVVRVDPPVPKHSCKGLEGSGLKRCEASNRRIEIELLEAD